MAAPLPGPVDAHPCSRCSRLVLWTITAAGARMPVDPTPAEDGNTAVYTDGVGTRKSRRITNELPLLPYEWCAMPHAATCPAPRHRTRPTPRQRPTVRRRSW